MAHPPYGYKKSETDKDLWVINEDTAPVVRKIFKLCIEGHGPTQIAKILTKEGILTPTAYEISVGNNARHPNAKLHRWGEQSVVKILENMAYIGHTVNFKTRTKSYKHKKRVDNPKEEWLIFRNTHEPIISQHDFDLVQEIRKNRIRPQKNNTVNPFSGMVYCADCGSLLRLCRAKSLTDEQEHLKCGKYASDKDECTAHFIRTCVLREIVLNEVNKLLQTVKDNEDDFVKAAMDNSVESHFSELKKARKTLAQHEKRISELDKLFTRLYEDNVSGKVSDERFSVMSNGYENEQKQLKQAVLELTDFIKEKEQKSTDTTQFLNIVRKYTTITKLTPEIMHELIEKIIVHAPDKSSGHREQQIDIYYRFNVAVSTAVAKRTDYDNHKRRKAA